MSNAIFYSAPVKYGSKFRSIILKYIMPNSDLGTRCEIALGGMLQNRTNANSIMVQVTACLQTIVFIDHCLGYVAIRRH